MFCPYERGMTGINEVNHRILLSRVTGDFIGFNTGNGEKLRYSLAEPGKASYLAVA